MKTYKQVLETSEGRLPMNVIDWAESFLELRLWNSQKEVLLSIFEEKCPVCAQVDTSFSFSDQTITMDIEAAEKPSLFENNECPMCGTTRNAGLLSGKLRDVSHVYGVFGQRSGSTTMLFVVITYWLQLVKKDGGWSSIAKRYGLDCTIEYEVAMPTLIQGVSEKTIHYMVHSFFFQEARDVAVSNALADVDPAWRGLFLGRGRSGTTKAAVFLADASWFGAESDDATMLTSNKIGRMRDEIAFVAKTCQKVPRGPSSSFRPLFLAMSAPRRNDDWLVKQVHERANDARSLIFWKPTWEMNPSLPKDSKAMKAMLASPSGQRDFGLVFEDPTPKTTLAQRKLLQLKAIADKVRSKKREEDNKKFSDLADLKKEFDAAIEARWKTFEEEFVVENFERFKSIVEKDGKVRLEGEKYTLLTTFPWPVGPDLVKKLWASGFASIGGGTDDQHGHPIYTAGFNFLNVKATALWEEDMQGAPVVFTFDFRL